MSDASDNHPIFARLRERKLVQWAIAYLAGSWLLLEVTSFAGESFGWPESLNQILLIVFAFGLVATLVLAWYHGEKGRQRLGGMELVILAVVLAGAGAALTTVGGEPVVAEEAAVRGPSMEEIRERFEGDRPRLAVMPFENISEGPEDAAFVRGLHAEFLTRLQGIGGLQVIDRQSVQLLEGATDDVTVIGEALGVEYVLVGSAQRSGDRVSANFRLVDAVTREQLWAESYTSSTTTQELIDLQANVAQRLAAELRVAMTDQERIRLGQRMTQDPEAYTLFLRAVAARSDLSPLEASRRTIDLLETAVGRDPDFGFARMILVNTLASQYGYLGDRSGEVEEKARAHLDVLVGRSSGFVPLAAANYQYFVRRDYDLAYQAIRGVGDALAVGADGLFMSALIDRRIGNFESALTYGVQAASLAPLQPIEAENTETLRFLGRFAEAEEALRQRLARFPQDRRAQEYLAQYLAHQGEFDEARRIYRSPRGYFDVWSTFFERDWEATEGALENGPPHLDCREPLPPHLALAGVAGGCRRGSGCRSRPLRRGGDGARSGGHGQSRGRSAAPRSWSRIRWPRARRGGGGARRTRGRVAPQGE